MASQRFNDRHARAAIPAYLRDDSGTGLFPDSVHALTIHARASSLDCRIEPQRHHALYRAIWIGEGGANLAFEGEKEGEGKVTALGPQSFAWIPPQVAHGYGLSRGTTGVVVSIPVPTLARAFPKTSALRPGLDRTIVIEAADQPGRAFEGSILFESLLGEYAALLPGRDEGLVSRAALLALWFARRGAWRKDTEAGAPSSDAAVVRRFLAEVERCFADRQALPDYARAIGVSLPHLGRLCRQVTGHSALKLLHERIVLEAKRSLVYTALPVGEVALRLGFEDPAYFSRFFRERTGRSPQAFRTLAASAGDG